MKKVIEVFNDLSEHFDIASLNLELSAIALGG
jgi:hypothetical protein